MIYILFKYLYIEFNFTYRMNFSGWTNVLGYGNELTTATVIN